MISEINDTTPFMILALLALVFSLVGIGIAVRIELGMHTWVKALNRIEWMLGIKRTHLMTLKEFRERVKELEDARIFDKTKYNKFGIYDDPWEDYDDEEWNHR